MATNPILDALNNRSNLPTTPNTNIGSNPILNAASRNAVSTTLPSNITLPTSEKEEEKKQTKWEWVSKQLMKPVGAVAAEVEGLGKFIGSAIAKATVPKEQRKETDIDWYIPGVGAAKVLSGVDKKSFTNVWQDAIKPETDKGKLAVSIIGGTLDIVEDPLNFVGGGLTKLGKLASKVSSLEKAGKTVKEGSKIAKEIEKFGYTVEQLKLASSKLGQVQAGQRAAVNILGKPIVKGEKMYEALGKVGATVKATKPIQALQKIFSTKTGVKEFDELHDAYKNLSNYRKEQVIEIAADIQKAARELTPEQVRLAVDALEDPAIRKTIKDTKVIQFIDRLDNLFNTMKIGEKAKGVLKSEIENYFPHIKPTEPWSKRVAKYFGSKKYGTSIGAAKERKIWKVADEVGAEKVGNYKMMGLKKINRDLMQSSLENQAAQKVTSLQRLIDKLASPEIKTATADLKKIIDDLKKNIPSDAVKISKTADVVEPTAEELASIIKSVVNPRRDEMLTKIAELEDLVKASAGKEFLSTPLAEKAMKASREAQIKWAYDEIIKTQNELADKIGKLNKFDFVDKDGKLYKRMATTISEIEEKFGKGFFETNPAIAYAQRGMASAKAVTAKEFLDEVGKKFMKAADDAPTDWVESTNPLFQGMKGPREIVDAVDSYIQGIKPEELKVVLRGLDAVQNLWKAQALIAPSYHTRNMVGNFWNNFLAGVKNPEEYYKAARIPKLAAKEPNRVILTTAAGETYTAKQLLEAAKQRGVVGRGLYGAEIPEMIQNELETVSSLAKNLKNLKGWKAMNPLSQGNLLFKSNKKIGSLIEDNARLTHFMHQLGEGYNVDDAARSVKKFLFDYEDLTSTERTLLKRFAPFYTWTRKNIPLQLENMVVQPAKYAAIPKIIEAWETNVPEPSTERYMSDYIRENVPLRIRKNDEGNYEYLLLGSWLPSVQAVDFLSQPFENIVGMTTPFIKTPLELWANQSMFFQNTLGEPSKIEYYNRQPTTFVGQPMRRKTAHLLRNVRLLNEIDKLTQKGNKDDPQYSPFLKFMSLMIGKATPYDISKSRQYYNQETDDRANEIKASVKKAKRLGNTEYAKKLNEQLKAFIKERGR